MDAILDGLINRILSSGVTGISLSEETGFYKHSSGSVNRMTNSVLYFFSEESYDYAWIVDFVKKEMMQETVLMIIGDEAVLF